MFDPKTLFDPTQREKSNFLSRIFGIFSEGIVDIWLKNEKCPYKNLGRPKILDNSDKKSVTLDFTFKCKETQEVYIVEQKCLYAFQYGRLATMNGSDEFKKAFLQWSDSKENTTLAWKYFKKFTNDQYRVKVDGQDMNIDGKILLWGSCNEDCTAYFQKKFKVHKIIGVDEIIRDLVNWGDCKYVEFIKERKKWIGELFEGLQ